LQRANFKTHEKNLTEPEKRKLNEIFEEELRAQKDIINAEISRDREHLRLVNFAAAPFLFRGTLGAATRYFLVRVEPLLKLGVKNCDVAVYNGESKVLILVECKSSIAKPSDEVDHTILAAKEAIAHKKDLDDMVGDTIGLTEFVLCTNAAYVARVREYVTDKDLPVCLWSADQATGKLLIEKQGRNTQNEIAKGRLHHDSKLTGLLIEGVASIGVRPILFLPSAHPCTILEETLPLLQLALEKAGQTRFQMSDIHTLLKGEASLFNVTDGELWSICEHIVKQGLEPQIFRDCSLSTTNWKDKEFEVAVKKGSVRTMTKDVRAKYTEFHSVKNSQEKSLEKFDASREKEGIKRLEDFGKSSN